MHFQRSIAVGQVAIERLTREPDLYGIYVAQTREAARNRLAGIATMLVRSGLDPLAKFTRGVGNERLLLSNGSVMEVVSPAATSIHGESLDIAIMDESEARLLSQSHNIFSAARSILKMGPKTVIIKRGQYGAIMLSGDDHFMAPAFPIYEFKDPTGAGDSFAGGFLGYLDQVNEFTPQILRQAVIHGTAVASFTISEFSIDGLRSLTKADIERRYYELQKCTHFENKECII